MAESSFDQKSGLLVPTRRFSIEKDSFDINFPIESESHFLNTKSKGKLIIELSRDFIHLLFSAIQISLSYICLSFILSVNLYFLGQNDKTELISAIGLGNVWINFTSMHLVYGLNSGFEVLASQAFGSQKLKYFRELKMKAATVIAGLLLLSFALCFFVKPVFLAFGYDSRIVELMSEYVILSFPSIIFLAFFDLEVESLNCQGCFSIQFFIVLFTASMHPLWCYLFVNINRMEIPGVAIAQFITFCSNLVLIKIVKFFLKLDKSKSSGVKYASVLKQNYSAWANYFSQVIPIASSVFFDIFALETITFIAGGMSNNILITVHVLYVNIEAFFASFSEGYGAAIYAFVGSNLGSGNIIGAKRWAKLGVFGCISIVGLCSTLFLLFSGFFSGLLSENLEINETFKKFVHLFVIYLFLNSIFTSCKAVIMILGKSKRMVLLTFIISYIIQLPIIGIFTFRFEFGLSGIWGTMIGCIFFEIIIELIWISRLNWQTNFLLEANIHDEPNYFEIEKPNRKKSLLS